MTGSAADPGGDLYDVFVSYAPSDAERVGVMVDGLERAGLAVFFDRRQLAPGENWEEATIAALRGSATAVEMIGPGGYGSLGRMHLPDQLVKADRADLAPVAVFLTSAPEGVALPGWLSAAPVIDLRGRPDEQAVDLLREALTAKTAPTPARVPPRVADLLGELSGELTAAEFFAAGAPETASRPGALPVVEGAERQPAVVWLRRVALVCDLGAADLGGAEGPAFSLAMALLEPALWDALAGSGTLAELESALPVPLNQILTPVGRQRRLALDRPPAAGYRPDDLLGADMLDVTADVNALCDIVMSRDVRPPLSIGLFAEWGAGKSFFMARMHDRIEQLRDQARAAEAADRPVHWCTGVTQITFNAWHYIDANLWASLAARVFEELDGGASARRTALLARMTSLRGAEEVARVAGDQAAAERTAAEVQLASLQAQRASLVSNLADVSTADVARSVAADPGVRAEISAAAQTLGLPGDVDLRQLGSIVAEVRTLGGRVARVWRLLGRSRHAWRRRLVVLGLLALAVAVAWFVARPGAAPVVAAVASVVVAVAGATRTALAVLAPGSAVLKRVEDVYTSAAARVRAAEQVQATRENALRDQLAVLDTSIAQRRAELARLADQIAELMGRVEPGDTDPARFYARVLGGFASDDYRDRLGVVSAIERDFRQLARLLPTGGLPGLPRVERIVLYIDDLDRCSAAQVVQVLQAVHLLLAFPLFVVVVGVDPRWLMRSLRVHHAAMAAADTASVSAPDELADLAATPQAYLEKIFQIPFRLRPMRADGYARLLADLLPVSAGTGAPAGSMPVPPTNPRSDSARPAAPDRSVAGRPVGGEPAGSGSLADLDTTPRAVVLDPHELRFLQGLAPLVTTPRAAKRLANVYRLVRASVPPSRLSAFLGEQGAAEYPAVMFLLALLVGAPAVAEDLLGRLRVQAGPDEPGRRSFPVLLGECLAGVDPDLTALVRRAADLLPDDDPLDPMLRWAPYVARFSFYPGR